MSHSNRREFLADVGRGMLVGTLGSALALDMELIPKAFAEQDPQRLSFGKLEPLVGMVQDTPSEQILSKCVQQLNQGVDLKTMTAAAALANARRFGGQDYTGYHTFMALAPAYEMSRLLPSDASPLPVLKVIYRNTQRMQQTGGTRPDTLKPVEPTDLPANTPEGELLRQAVRNKDVGQAERTLVALASEGIGEAYNHLQYTVQDEIDVHRVVLPWRAWMSLDLTGKEYATTLLRMSVRFCVDAEKRFDSGHQPSPLRDLLPKLLDQYRLLSKPIGTEKMDDAWLEKMSRLVYSAGRERAADAVAAALAEGVAPETIGEVLSRASCLLVLHDPGRAKPEDGRPVGSVHGASRGVHATDSANAWRNIARVSNTRNTLASLIAGAYHTAGQSAGQLADGYPMEKDLEGLVERDPAILLSEAEKAIQERNQSRACALVHRYGTLGQAPKPIFDMLLKYATSEDGALHAEKYYQTVCEEYETCRESFRWQHLVALARVTASEFGFTAPGYQQARRLLKLS